jgi:4-hydroxybenzoate polyprenyltransferase
VVALSVDRSLLKSWSWVQFFVGLMAICAIVSSNYVINEILDAPTDLFHPIKKNRPVPAGRVDLRLAYVQWIGLMLTGLGLASLVSRLFAGTLFTLWIMGCLYNIPPGQQQRRPLSGCRFGSGQQSVADVSRLVSHRHYLVGAGFAPAQLLDDRLLLHGY